MKAIDRMYFNKYAIDPENDLGDLNFQEDIWQADLDYGSAEMDALDQEDWSDME
jgi:hypothetical protein